MCVPKSEAVNNLPRFGLLLIIEKIGRKRERHRERELREKMARINYFISTDTLGLCA